MTAKSSKIARFYGYAVCFITIITFLINCNSIVNAMFDLSEPLLARSFPQQRNAPELNLSSFEAYRSTALGVAALKDLTETDLRAKYEATRDNKIRMVRHNANRTLTVSSLILVLSIILFISHWLWMRRLAVTEE